MAQAQSLIVNDNKTEKDTRAINTFIEHHIFMNRLLKFKRELDASSTIVEIDSRYNFRPDRLAYEHYGEDFWYPAILLVNNMGSMLQFKADILNYKCKIPSSELIQTILSENIIEPLNIEDNTFKNFK